MKKKMVFGCIFSIVVLLFMPCVSSLNSSMVESDVVDDEYVQGFPKWGRPITEIALWNFKNLNITVEGEVVDPETLDTWETYKNVKITGKLEDTTDQNISGLAYSFSIFFLDTVLWNLICKIEDRFNLDDEWSNHQGNKLTNYLIKLPGCYQFISGEEFEIRLSRMEFYEYGDGLPFLTFIGFMVRIY